jgi:hypothetical protein
MNGIDITAVLIQQEIVDARRRFRLHIIWSTVCAAVGVAAFFAGVVTGAVTVLK